MKTLEFHKRAFIIGTTISTILFVGSVTGTAIVAPEYLEALNTLLKYYVCAFLLIRFNPFVDLGTADPSFERKVAFSAGLFLMLSLTVTGPLTSYLQESLHK